MVNNKTFFVLVFLIFFVSIAGAFANNVSEVSNNPNSDTNANLIVDSASDTSQISTNEISQDAVSNSSNGNTVLGISCNSKINNYSSVLKSNSNKSYIDNNNLIYNETVINNGITTNSFTNGYNQTSTITVSNSKGNIIYTESIFGFQHTNYSSVILNNQNITTSIYSPWYQPRLNTTINNNNIISTTMTNLTLNAINANNTLSHKTKVNGSVTSTIISNDAISSVNTYDSSTGLSTFEVNNNYYNTTEYVVINSTGQVTQNIVRLGSSVNNSKFSTLISDSGSTIYKGDSFVVSLTDSNNKGISLQTVAVNVNSGFNNKTYYLTTNNDGNAYLPINLISRTYLLTYYFSGNDIYNGCEGSTNLTVINGISTKIILDNTISRGNNLSILLTDINNNPLSNQQISLIFNRGSLFSNPYILTTNSEGKASIQINLVQGLYNLYYNFSGNSVYRNISGQSNLTVNNESINKINTKISGSTLTVNPNYTNLIYNITLSDVNNQPLSGQNISITIKGVTYIVVTNSKGIASVLIPKGYSTGSYPITYTFLGNSIYYSSTGVSNLIINNYNNNKSNSLLIVNNLSMIQGDGSNLTVVLTDSNGNPIANQNIIFTLVKGSIFKNYTVPTNLNGVASLLIGLSKGEYNFKYYYAGNSIYNPATASSGVTVSAPKTPTSIKSSDLNMYQGSGQSFTSTLMDIYGNVLSDKKLIVTFIKSSGVSFNYSYVTDDSGIINIPIGLAVGTYSVQVHFEGDNVYTGSTGPLNTISVKTAPVSSTLSIAEIVGAATYIRDYVTANAYLPSNVTINKVTYSIGDACYFIAQSLVNINSGNMNNINIIDVDAAPNPTGDYISGQYNTTKLINVAIKVVNFVNAHGYDPNYVNTTLGSMSFNDYTYAMSKTLIFYSTNNRFPNFVVISSSSVNGGSSSSNYPTTQFISGLNEKNNGADTSQYYINSSNWKCNSQSSTIINLATKLTMGLTSEWDKATAIFNYVRDSISYSYYSNSVRGAEGTLNAGKGNCVDQASLVVAISRAAGLAARYCHGQGCTFTSGLVTGHVWAQILVGNTWYSADPTSIRNSLGNVKNWNVNSFSNLNKYYLVPF